MTQRKIMFRGLRESGRQWVYWYIGQEIVCVRSHSQGHVTEGNVYKIRSLKASNCNCYSTIIDIGQYSHADASYCPVCGNERSCNGIRWFSERLFVPLEYDQQAIEELLKIQEPQKA